MFSRNSDKEVPPVIPATAAPASAPPPVVQPARTPAVGEAMSNSVIGRDLTIIGSGLKIISRGLLKVDGEVQGDVVGLKVVIGPTGKVTGLVNAEEIVVQGAVYGTIKAVDVKLAASSVVEGDLYHQNFALEQGARFEGRSRRTATREELAPDFAKLEPPAK